jgi:hypothetical protein
MIRKPGIPSTVKEKSSVGDLGCSAGAEDEIVHVEALRRGTSSSGNHCSTYEYILHEERHSD